MKCMTTKQIIQARVSATDVRQLDEDRAVLGIESRSDALRIGLRLLHLQARETALAQEYDAFYGNTEAPMSDLAAAGDQIAAETMSAKG